MDTSLIDRSTEVLGMAYKALRSVRGPASSREAARMMQRMGMDMKQMEDVTQVIIKTGSKHIVIDDPSVMTVTCLLYTSDAADE